MSRTLSGRSVSSLACPVGTSSSLLASLYASYLIRAAPSFCGCPTNRVGAVRNFRECPKGEVRTILLPRRWVNSNWLRFLGHYIRVLLLK